MRTFSIHEDIFGLVRHSSLSETASRTEAIDPHQVAEELQMVDISLLFRKAETSFFINLHNALMLHTHYYRYYAPFL